MILRVFTATAVPGREDDFQKVFTERAIPSMRRQRGLVRMIAGTPRAESPGTFFAAMVWNDVASLRAYAGEDWRQPHILPSEVGVVGDRSLMHYDLVADFAGMRPLVHVE